MCPARETDDTRSDLIPVDVGKHDCLNLCPRSPRPARLWARLRRRGADGRLHQRLGNSPRMLFLNLWPSPRPAPDGSISLFFRLLWSEAQSVVPHAPLRHPHALPGLDITDICSCLVFFLSPSVAVFNILACIGWSSVNSIVGAQLLAAINPGPHALPGWAGILIIALSTLLITTFGYRLVHAYERWSWIPVLVIFCIVAGEFGTSGKFANLPIMAGKAGAGAVLSFAASVFGFSTGWTSMASDYAVYQPETRPRRTVFLWTFGGLIFPLLFTELLGVAVMTAYAVDKGYAEAYDNNHIGGVLAMVLVPRLAAFGRFCLAVLALSIIANNCPNIYSVSLSLQVLAGQTQRIPRFVWPAIATAVYVAISVPGYSKFEEVLENFMLLIGYWLAIYEGIALTEHFVFRRSSGYVVDDYATPGNLPPGYSALCAFLFGVMGAALGMAQSWYIGPIGKLCGAEFGGDVGFELAFGFSAVAYLVLRSVERQWFRR
jgi:NCS1 nucleoside transporter family